MNNSNITEKGVEIYIDRLYDLFLKNKKKHSARTYAKVANCIRLLPRTVAVDNAFARLGHRIYISESDHASLLWTMTVFVTVINLLTLAANLLDAVSEYKIFIVITILLAVLCYNVVLNRDSGKKKAKMYYYKFALSIYKSTCK